MLNAGWCVARRAAPGHTWHLARPTPLKAQKVQFALLCKSRGQWQATLVVLCAAGKHEGPHLLRPLGLEVRTTLPCAHQLHLIKVNMVRSVGPCCLAQPSLARQEISDWSCSSDALLTQERETCDWYAEVHDYTRPLVSGTAGADMREKKTME